MSIQLVNKFLLHLLHLSTLLIFSFFPNHSHPIHVLSYTSPLTNFLFLPSPLGSLQEPDYPITRFTLLPSTNWDGRSRVEAHKALGYGVKRHLTSTPHSRERKDSSPGILLFSPGAGTQT